MKKPGYTFQPLFPKAWGGLLLFFFLYFLCSFLCAQQESENQIKLIADGVSGEKAIHLKWAPNNPQTFTLAKQFGYRLERFTLVKDKEILSEPIKKVLQEAIFPAAEEEWIPLAQEDDLAAIILQALYGESFEFEEGRSKLFNVQYKMRDQQARFSFALTAAEQSLQLSEMLGIYFKDTDVAQNEKYLYKVIPLIPDSLLSVAYGIMYYGLEDVFELPKIAELKADFSAHQVVLEWDARHLQNIYSYYHVERSLDGKRFERINKQPVFPLNTRHQQGKAMFLDSLKQANQTYHYRVIGVNSFARTGPASEAISGKSQSQWDAHPEIQQGEAKEGKVYLNWTFPTKVEALIQGFNILHAEKSEGPFRKAAEALAPGERDFIHYMPFENNYYQVEAFDSLGRSTRSLELLVALPDSLPPAIPQGLEGSIDENGRVQLQWKANREADLSGYRVYRANYAHEEAAEITVRSLKKPALVDTLSLQNLTRTVYYYVEAVDKNGNRSGLSKALKIIKPDQVPPGEPLWQQAKVHAGSIDLSWIPSPSPDVAFYLIYRQSQEEEKHRLLELIPPFQNRYTDRDIRNGLSYHYILLAVDSAENESQPRPLLVEAAPENLLFEDEFFYQVETKSQEVEIRWVGKSETPYAYFLIYRSQGEEELHLVSKVAFEDRTFIDEKVAENTSYSYRLRAQKSDGSTTSFSKDIKVQSNDK